MVTQLCPPNSVEQPLNGVINTTNLDENQVRSLQLFIVQSEKALLRLKNNRSLTELHYVLASSGLNLVAAEVVALERPDRLTTDFLLSNLDFNFIFTKEKFSEWIQGAVLLATTSITLLAQQNMLDLAEAATIRCGLQLVSTELEKLVQISSN